MPGACGTSALVRASRKIQFASRGQRRPDLLAVDRPTGPVEPARVDRRRGRSRRPGSREALAPAVFAREDSRQEPPLLRLGAQPQQRAAEHLDPERVVGYPRRDAGTGELLGQHDLLEPAEPGSAVLRRPRAEHAAGVRGGLAPGLDEGVGLVPVGDGAKSLPPLGEVVGGKRRAPLRDRPRPRACTRAERGGRRTRGRRARRGGRAPPLARRRRRSGGCSTRCRSNVREHGGAKISDAFPSSGATSAADRHSGKGSTRGLGLERGRGCAFAAVAVAVDAVDGGRDTVLVHDDLEVVGGLATVAEHRIDADRLPESRRRPAGAAASTTAEGRRAGARRADHRDAPDRGASTVDPIGRCPDPRSEVAVPPARHPEQMFSMGPRAGRCGVTVSPGAARGCGEDRAPRSETTRIPRSGWRAGCRRAGSRAASRRGRRAPRCRSACGTPRRRGARPGARASGGVARR